MLKTWHYIRRKGNSIRSYTRLIACIVLYLAGSEIHAVEPPVTALAFTADGQSVVVGSQVGLRIFSWPELVPRQKLKTAMTAIHDLAFSPNSQLLAVGGGQPDEEGITEILSWPGGKSLSILRDHEDSVYAVAWLNNVALGTASLDHNIMIRNWKTKQLTHHLQGHSQGVSTIQFLPNSKTLISGGLDQNIRVWDVTSGSQIRSLNNHTKRIHGISIRPHSAPLPMLASISRDRTVRLWQPTIGRMVRFTRTHSIPLAVAWLNDGSRVVVSCEDGDIRLINPDTAEVTQKIPAVTGWAYTLAVHPTDNSLLVGGRNGQLKRVIPDSR